MTLLQQTITALIATGWEILDGPSPPGIFLWRPGQRLVIEDVNNAINLNYQLGTLASGYKTGHRANGLTDPNAVIQQVTRWYEQEFG